MELQAGLAFGELGLLFADPAGEGGVIGRRQLEFQAGDAVGEGGEVERLEDGLLVDRRAGVVAGIAVEPRVAQRIEVGEHLEVVLLADRVEFMVVALRAPEGEPEHGLAQRLHAVGIVVHEVLGRDGAALVGVHVVALEARGDELRIGRVGQEVARELLQHELVVG